MTRVMKHPWVTKRGQWPLRSVREMVKEHGKVMNDDEPELPDLMSTYNVLDVPRQVPSPPPPPSPPGTKMSKVAESGIVTSHESFLIPHTSSIPKWVVGCKIRYCRSLQPSGGSLIPPSGPPISKIYLGTTFVPGHHLPAYTQLLILYIYCNLYILLDIC
jgi:hypothetical protein